MAECNDISGLLSFIGREGDWRDRLQDVVAAHLMPALEYCEIDQDGLADLLPVRAIVIYAANAVLDNVIARDSAKQCVNPAPATNSAAAR